MTDNNPNKRNCVINCANYHKCPYWQSITFELKDFLTWILPIKNSEKISYKLPYICKKYTPKSVQLF